MKKKFLPLLAAAFLAVGSAGGEAAGTESAAHEKTAAAFRLSLADSVNMALARDESIEAAEARTEQARHSLSAARRASGPTVGWRSGASRIGGRSYETSRRYYWLGRSNDAYNNSFSNSFSLEIPLYTGGRIEGTIDSRRYQLSAADLALENTKQTVRYQVTEAYYGVLQQQNRVSVAESAARMAEEQLGLIEAQYEEGAVAKADVLHMQVQLANNRQTLVSERGALHVAKTTLLLRVGLPAATEIETTDGLSYAPYPMALPECIGYALEHRPDAAAAEYAVKQYEAAKEATKAGNRPSVSAVATKNITDDRAFRSSRSETWEAGLSLSWNVFDNNVTRANVEAAKSEAEQRKAEAALVQREIRLQTESAYVQMKAAEENIRSTKEAVKQAEENYMIAQVRYEEGVDILLTVTDAQDKLTQARTNYCSALYAYNLQKAALEKAMGVPVDIDVPLYVAAIDEGESSPKAREVSALHTGDEK